jgi:transcriptional regulator with XRE-family HTH domain
LEKLGPLAENQYLMILDCFTNGIGQGSEVFLKFYEDAESHWPCEIILVEKPRDREQFQVVFYKICESLKDDVRFVFESLTGMQKLWGGEEYILNFYSHSCPRLYELKTIAFWILEKKAHTAQLRANINQIAQVAIDLSVKRGTTYLTILKAEGRQPDSVDTPFPYWCKDLAVIFEGEKRTSGQVDIGLRLNEFRTKRGLTQTELANLVGVTPSSISQIESNMIYPSLPALLKIAEVLSVEVSSFFQEKPDISNRIIFPAAESVDITFSDIPAGSLYAKLLVPVDIDSRAEPYLIEIPPNKSLQCHFFVHKGEEVGYLLSGRLQMKLQKAVYTAKSGDTILLSSEIPSQWKNPGPGIARLLWLKIK